jgi:CRP/FNR family transcriptional regulator, cyclic AMP receptor protein
MVKKKSKATQPFDAGVYLQTAGVKRKIVQYRKRQTIFSQGDASKSVLYLQAGTVKITVTSSGGKEAVIALLQPGEFFGEGGISASLCEFRRRRRWDPFGSWRLRRRR